MLYPKRDRVVSRQLPKARSSVAEHCHHMAEVGGSTPSAPTIACWNGHIGARCKGFPC